MLVYVDDGHPESRDYADNYVRVEPRSLFRSLLGLPPRTVREVIHQPRDVRSEASAQPA